MSRESKRKDPPAPPAPKAAPPKKPIKKVRDASSAIASPVLKGGDKGKIAAHEGYQNRVRTRAEKAVSAIPDASRGAQEKAVRDEARKARDTYKEELGTEPDNVHVEVTGENEDGGKEKIVVDVPSAKKEKDKDAKKS